MSKEKIEFYREKAVELRTHAEQLQNDEARTVFLNLANSYEIWASEIARIFLTE